MRKTIFLFYILVTWSSTTAQETYYNQTRHTQFVNPSFYGMNAQSFAGFGYNSLSYQTNETIDSKLFYGVMSFNNLNFSISADFSNFQVNQYGLVQNLINLSYIYRLEVFNDTYFLPSLSVGLGFHQLENSALIFGDQLNLISGSISTTSNDPLSYSELNSNYLDFGAAMLLYNENFMVGLSLKHLNQPDVSMNKEFNLKKPMSLSFQAAYERDINYFGRSFLPNESYLYLYSSVTSVGQLMKIYAGQELILGGFAFGIHESYTSSEYTEITLDGNQETKTSNALLMGINCGLNIEEFEFNLSYNFPLSQSSVVYPPNIFELSMIIKFDRFLRNNRGYFKRLKIDGLF